VTLSKHSVSAIFSTVTYYLWPFCGSPCGNVQTSTKVLHGLHLHGVSVYVKCNEMLMYILFPWDDQKAGKNM
jgi:hypothetical protein